MKKFGNHTKVVTYPKGSRADTSVQRSEKRRISGDRRQKINDNRSRDKFRTMLIGNFGEDDLVYTLTYDDSNLPVCVDRARRVRQQFLRRLREACRDADLTLKYMGVTEGQHGDHRLHHHIVVPNLPGIDILIDALWDKKGYTKFEPIGEKGYDYWAQYLTKEPGEKGRRRVGQHIWFNSKNLMQPKIEKGLMSDAAHFTPPVGAYVIHNEPIINEFGEFQYIEWIDKK